MAWLFSLSIECGTDGEAAERVARHFAPLVVPLGAGETSTVTVSTSDDGDGGRWCVVSPERLPRNGISSIDDAARATAAGRALYERLRSAPAYRYALAGVEVDHFRTHRELVDDAPDGLPWDGLVLADALWSSIGRPEGLQPFAPGYRWRPWTGITAPG